MLFSVSLFSIFCLVPVVVAFQPMKILDPDSQEYDYNWAGALWKKPNGTFSFITGKFTLPTPASANGDSATAWIGIDGVSCQQTILRAGIVLTVENGAPYYYATHEWYPAMNSNFTNITFDAGDNVGLNILASNSTSGIAAVQNFSKNQTVFTELSSYVPLCEQDAEWVVEYDTEGTSSDFDTITFTDAYAIGKDSEDVVQSYNSSGADILNIKRNNTVLTSVTTNGSSLTIKYV